jgi:alpha-beta hydrolase superfamily lysophospholipase
VREERVAFYSAGERVAGILRLPDDGTHAPYRAIVQGPGWLQLKESKRNGPYHRAFTDAGFAVLIIDFRGTGESEGDGLDVLPERWIDDLRNAVSYLETRDDIRTHVFGTFGSGSTGGGNAVLLAAADARVRCVIAQTPISDGADWLRRMRREHEWLELLARLDADRRRRILTGRGGTFHPRRDLMVVTPGRNERTDTDDGHVHDISIRSADAILAYRPIDVVRSVAGLLVVAVEDDAVTPTDHATALYEAALEPKKLILQRGTTHYAAYTRYADVVIPQMVEWLTTHLAYAPLDTREARR